MGIKGLFPFLSDAAPASIKGTSIKDYTNRVLAIDASTCLYQFIVAVRSDADNYANLTNDRGEVTSHITGFLNRTLRLLEAGIKPVYVFDGKAPDLKARELKGRVERRALAEEDEARAREAGEEAKAKVKGAEEELASSEAAAAKAREEGDEETLEAAEARLAAARSGLEAASADAKTKSQDLEKATHRSAKVTRQHHEDAKALLALMGVPVVQAPGEAEATCARMVRDGVAYGAVTEDMDVLTFGAPVMVKNLFDTENSRMGAQRSAAERKPVYEVALPTVLDQLGLPMAHFVDFCILCGCDYVEAVPKVGPSTAIKLVLQHGTIDKILEAKALPEASRAAMPADWPYEAARKLFLEPDVAEVPASAVAQGEAKYEELSAFLVERHSFSESRVEAALKRLRACKGAKTQTRLDQFFNASPAKGSPKVERYDPFAKKRKGSPASGSKGKGPGASPKKPFGGPPRR